MSRALRLGQTDQVVIKRYVVMNTVEEVCFNESAPRGIYLANSILEQCPISPTKETSAGWGRIR